MTQRSAEAEVRVPVDTQTAFTAFTAEIARWWVPGPINFWDAARCTGRLIEPGRGGRVLELYGDDAPLEIGVVTIWEPGARFAYDSSVDETEVEVTFTALDGGTRVAVVQRLRAGADETRPAFYFWANVIRWFDTWCDERADRLASPEPRRVARLSVALTYDDPAAAARWLNSTFGLTSWDGIPPEGSAWNWIELHVGNVAVLLFPADDQPVADDAGAASRETHHRAARQRMWVYVQDVDEHFARAEASGAEIVSGMHEHGYRGYTAADLDGHLWTFVQTGPWVA
jgi:uncharacterized glyoxalase superfamily protein PhnB